MLPAPAAPSRRAHALAAAAVLLSAGAAFAFDLALEPPRAADGQVWVNVRLEDPFEARVEESLQRGMPATLQIHAEVWRRRTAWFDRLERTFDASVRLRYDVWDDAFRIERAAAPAQEFGSLDSLERALERPLAVPVARVASLQPQGRYYVVVSMTLKPLNVEDVEEVEGWLSGEVKDKGRGGGLGVITQLPRSLFDAVRNFTGFGDVRDRAITQDFQPAMLPERR